MQVPPPPQADGKNILLLPNVFKRVPPEDTSTLLSPFIERVTGPEGRSLALAPKSMPTSKKVITKKTTTLATITVKSISILII